jgi:hypothetical protein
MFFIVYKYVILIGDLNINFLIFKVDHLTLSKYAQMINSANLHDDLDVVTSVYLPESKSDLQYI